MKVLIVEDDLVTRLTLKKVLLKSNFEVIEAVDGSQGFSLFIETSPDLILMDVMMPKMGGYASIEAIRNYETNRSVPIIMLTSLDDINSIDHAFNAGATDFITKPINWTLLIQRVKYTIKASQNESKLLNVQSQLKYVQKLSQLGYWQWKIHKDEFSAAEAVFEMFAIPFRSNINMAQFTVNVLPKDLLLVQTVILEAVQGKISDIQISFRVKQHDNTIKHIDCIGEVIFDKNNKPYKVMGSAQDITRLHKAESLITYQSNHDKLTNLPNRSFFNETLKVYLKENSATNLSAVIVLDIDKFKKINDNLGQENGDILLSSIAQRLTKVTREGDFIARLGSDEFAILIKNIKDIKELNQSVVRIFNELTSIYQVTEQELFIKFSIGISIVEQDGATVSHLIANANVARSKAKQNGGDQFLFYQTAMNLESKKELILENDLHKALQRNEIEVYYQPQVYGDSLKPYGAEALVRWSHSTEGIISPVVFIPMAESSGLIVDIGLYVLKTAIKEAKKWHHLGYSNLHIGINLSGRQFSNTDLLKDVQAILTDSNLPAKYIDLEITESLVMSNAKHNISILKGLKALGVDISIDDFGTGYSSLSYLHSFPINAIKIDRSFIINLNTQEGQAIVNTIIVMAKSLQLAVIAEGVEDEFHVKFLQNKKCDIFQGYKFGKPMQADKFIKYLNTQFSEG